MDWEFGMNKRWTHHTLGLKKNGWSNTTLETFHTLRYCLIWGHVVVDQKSNPISLGRWNGGFTLRGIYKWSIYICPLLLTPLNAKLPVYALLVDDTDQKVRSPIPLATIKSTIWATERWTQPRFFFFFIYIGGCPSLCVGLIPSDP